MKLPGNLGLRATSIKYISASVTALGVLAFAAQADAADIYAPAPAPLPVIAPTVLWSGLYGGVHVGGAWADLNTVDLDNYYLDPHKSFFDNGGVSSYLHTDQSPSGVFGGGTIGYNMQRGGVVFGVEADFGAMDINGNKILTNPIEGLAETARAHISTGFYGDVTGRVGWAWGPWLIYGKGGLAVLEATTNVRDVPGYALPPTNDNTRVGWTAGGGFEYLWNPAWSVKVEYQYFDFGTTSSTLFGEAPDGGQYSTTYSFNHDLTINTVKVGLNYHLGCCDNALPPLK